MYPRSNPNFYSAKLFNFKCLPELSTVAPAVPRRWGPGPRGSRTLPADVPEGRLIWRCPRPLHSKQVGPALYIVLAATISLARVTGRQSRHISPSTTLIPPRCLSLAVHSRILCLRICWVLFSLVISKKEFLQESDWFLFTVAD